ncbi:NAD-dependent epimerase/dehydratase family protein [Calothrix sp. PCC 6303]|uniref:NAD-dependent epimerase/dehydratase family protein n=1 Tax=Calothrix sp. PCC 6303 TaxID=1170562 RepID=UPI0002A01F65|nr:NAD-dependent epimerase/dehydratase family protein [Calothrix sp. PCC 6303]AFY99800.1 NAD-dependent epimerase/dehydratase [Calothrix sp. PCC 6303]
MNIAIIGCGYVGSAVAKYWHQKMTLMVTATTTTPEKIHELAAFTQKAILLKGDEEEKLQNILKNQDCVLLSIAPGQNNTYEEAYLKTAKNIVKFLENTSVKHLIYTSTCSVYGDQNGMLVDEETAIKPSTKNGEILKQTEQTLLSAANDNLHVCILRLGGIYGAGRELVKIYSRVAGKIRPGTGDEPSNWIHLDDIVGAIELARSQNLSGIYNVVDEENLLNREVIARVCETHNLEPVIWDSSQPSKRNYYARISNQKLKNAGYKFIHPQMTF